MIKYRYFNNNRGPVKKNEIKAFQRALQICSTEKDIDDIILLIHSKSNTGYIERIFETRNVKTLFRGVKIDQKYPPVRIETVRTFTDQSQSKIVLLCFGLHSEEIYKYESFESVVGIVAHQWGAQDLQNWAKTYGAVDINKLKKPKNLI